MSKRRSPSCSLEIITMWKNEAALAPFFFRHYAWADRITILFTPVGPKDPLPDLAREYPNVHLTEFHFPDNKLDDDLKAARINQCYQQTRYDWALAVDSDELAFLKADEEFIYDLRPFLAQTRFSLFFIRFYAVYRHVNDGDLDAAKPPAPQRRHGDPNVFVGSGSAYNKPALARAGLPDFGWTAGCHNITRHLNTVDLSPEPLWGAHWEMADPLWAVPRCLRKTRPYLSDNNLAKGHGAPNFDLTENDVTKLLRRYENGPLLF